MMGELKKRERRIKSLKGDDIISILMILLSICFRIISSRFHLYNVLDFLAQKYYITVLFKKNPCSVRNWRRRIGKAREILGGNWKK